MDCETCSSNFSTAEHYENHQKTHRYKNNALFKCFNCKLMVLGFLNYSVHCKRHKSELNQKVDL